MFTVRCTWILILVCAVCPPTLFSQISCAVETHIVQSGDICGAGLISGQTFTATSTGWITAVQVARCAAAPLELSFRFAPEGNAAFNSGTSFGRSPVLLHTEAPAALCNPSVNGLASYQLSTLSTSDIGVQAGHVYVLEFLQGYGASSCTGSNYNGGQAYFPYAAAPLEDLIFDLTICEADIVFGCMDSTACNFDPLAEETDGSCLEADCNGDCGGSAYVIEGCGCVGGDTGLLPEDCYGCTDTTACNYNPTATFDNGQCAFLDCMGVCGGQATETECGCQGGTAPLPSGNCIDGCITQTFTNGNTPCAPTLMKGQIFTAPISGELRRIGVAACCGVTTKVVLRRATPEWECAPEVWNTDSILTQTPFLYPSCTGTSACQLPTSEGYPMRYANTPGVLLEGDTEYVLEFVSGYGVGSCSAMDLPGTSFDLNGNTNGAALLFELDICTAPEALSQYGCTDSEADNYSTSATVDDGSCADADCAGIIGGPHLDIPGCGCVDIEAPGERITCHQGVPQTVVANAGEGCGETGLGQTWTQPEDGFLRAFQVVSDTTAALSVQLFHHDGPFSDSLLAEVSLQPKETGLCGQAGLKAQDLIFNEVPLQSGRKYRIEITDGAALLDCNAGYAGGEGWDGTAISPFTDLQFRMAYRPPATGELVWGCMDQTACNFDITATHDSGDCYGLDCNGECNGDAFFVEGCACIGGSTGLSESDCYGCTDPTACNYDASKPLEDGSCTYPDCTGLCGGVAVFDPECGCIGGNTGIDPSSCFERCQASVTTSNFGAANNFGFLHGTGALQSYSSSEEVYLTGIRLYQMTLPSDSLKLELRVGASFDSATALDTVSVTTLAEVAPFGTTIYEAFIELPETPGVQPGETLWLKLYSGNWLIPISPFNSIPEGDSYPFLGAGPQSDWYLQLLTCSSLLGCTDATACNYDEWATQLADGSCTAECTDPLALNFNSEPDTSCINNAYCEYAIGCMDAAACNFDAAATLTQHPQTGETATCNFPETVICETCTGATDGTGLIIIADTDGDGICNANEVPGCQNPLACNYNMAATDPAACVFPSACVQCTGESDGTGTVYLSSDLDGDGLCDVLDFCSDTLAINYDVLPTEDCIFDCDSMPSPLTLTGVTGLVAASTLEAEDGYVRIEYEGGHGDSLQWQATFRDIFRGTDTTILALTDSVGPLRPSLYILTISDGYGCLGRKPQPSPLPLATPTGRGYTVLPSSEVWHRLTSVPYNPCE